MKKSKKSKKSNAQLIRNAMAHFIDTEVVAKKSKINIDNHLDMVLGGMNMNAAERLVTLDHVDTRVLRIGIYVRDALNEAHPEAAEKVEPEKQSSVELIDRLNDAYDQVIQQWILENTDQSLMHKPHPEWGFIPDTCGVDYDYVDLKRWIIKNSDYPYKIIEPTVYKKFRRFFMVPYTIWYEGYKSSRKVYGKKIKKQDTIKTEQKSSGERIRHTMRFNTIPAPISHSVLSGQDRWRDQK